jgi:UTP--glucose-1-phosphate uridylyltransferase
MRALDAHEKGAGGEIQLTDAMARLIGSQPFHGYAFDGERHDCGEKIGFVIANLALGLADAAVAPAIRAFLAER